jgi:hypothetical protein
MNHRNLPSSELVRDGGEFARDPVTRVLHRPVFPAPAPLPPALRRACRPTPQDIVVLRDSAATALGACARISALLAALKAELAALG